MKKIQRKLSVKAGALMKGVTGVDHGEQFEDIDLTEKPAIRDESVNRVKERHRTRNESDGDSPDRRNKGGGTKLRRAQTVRETGQSSPSGHQRRKHKVKDPKPSNPVCGICYTDFRQPKLLPCSHTFCLLCLEKFVNPKLMVECPTCRKETQLSVLGVAGLPDNEKVNPKKNEELPINKISSRRVSLTGLNVGDPLDMRRQLEISFSRLERSQGEMEEDVKEMTRNVRQVVETKIQELVTKRREMEEFLAEVAEKKKGKHEMWRRESEHLIARISEMNDFPDEKGDMEKVSKLFADQMTTLDKLTTEYLTFDRNKVHVTLQRGILNGDVAGGERREDRKVSINIPRRFSPEFYKNSTLEETKKIKWPSCLQPRCVRLCPWSGHIWVCVSGSREIGIFSTDDSYIQSFTNPGFLFPCSIDFNIDTKEAYILDKRQAMIFIVTPDLSVSGSICREGRKPGCLSSPSSLVLDSQGRLLVSDDGNDRIQILTTEGTFVSFIGVHQQDGGKSQTKDLSSPQGLAMSVDGNVLAVADSGNNRIRTYDPYSGRQLHCFGRDGKGNGELERPIDLAWDIEGHLLVLDQERVQVFSENGEFLRKWNVKEGLHGIQVIGHHVLLSDTYSINKFLLKSR